jgi:glycosyltransferase involved in cell wall biosynthesis
VAEHDPGALAAALERLLMDSDLRVRLATAARELIERSFDARRNAAQIRNHFHMAEATLVPIPEEVR